jgi:PhoH-like ATPase
LTIRIAINEFLTAEKMSKELRRFQQVFRDLDKADNRILALCLYVKSKSPERTILVTKDLNMQLKALAIGVEAQDYENDKVEVTDVEGYAQRTIEIDPHARVDATRTIDVASPEPCIQTAASHCSASKGPRRLP